MPDAIEPITVNINEARRLSGLGTTKLYELMAAGRLEGSKLDGRRLIVFSSLNKLLLPKPPEGSQ
jgi:hypothetical protein